MVRLAATASPRAWLPRQTRPTRKRVPRTTTTRTLVSSVQLNRARGKIIYRIVLTLVIVAFTLTFIGPMYFLFTDGLKSTQEAIATPPTLYPHHIYPGTYKAAFDRLDIAQLMWNTL